MGHPVQIIKTFRFSFSYLLMVRLINIYRHLWQYTVACIVLSLPTELFLFKFSFKQYALIFGIIGSFLLFLVINILLASWMVSRKSRNEKIIVSFMEQELIIQTTEARQIEQRDWDWIDKAIEGKGFYIL